MEEERVRKEVEDILWDWLEAKKSITNTTIAAQILAIKLGSRTLKEWIELYEEGKLRIEADVQSLPANIYDDNQYGIAQQDMLKAGFVKVL